MPRISEATIAKHRHRTETALLDAWGGLLDERGYSDITLTLVAERAGVVRNTVYGYFPDKEHLLLAYLTREVGRFMDGATAAVDEAVGARARLRVLVDHQARYFATNAGAGQDLAGIASPDRYPDFAACFAPVRDLLVRIIREGIHEGVFRALDPISAARMTLALLGAYRVPLARATISPEEATDSVLDFLLHGIDANTAG
ncbi:MAG TPA: TetR/AcrR family transcriptional regulator [Thermomicrobiales bacterium]|nr:hypothetical protein [Chloroflexota bacterium]HQX61908.1 TetR/AcrR family transcriptional regulator [Thermomicrobiales bacterium]